ncbi:hypothetical protein H5410_001107 [Solanum commersonii]|uniref:F-box domain-containing protein n=1 Tax=Solanum commersonii TaxID=4109 RepID=A0A9J6AXZ9_SOLCO|nr:hypothetical protein H5410_001107 [Solanum commersonii]
MNSSIPQDIIIEIFSWLLAKSLMRFKCITKFFNSLVFESDFTDIYRYRYMTRPSGTKFLLQEKSITLLISKKTLPQFFKLSVLVNSPFISIFLRNLKEGFSWCHYSLGFEPEENKYKVLSTTAYVQKGYTKKRVFTLDIDKSWREIKNIHSPIMCKPGICINGVI